MEQCWRNLSKPELRQELKLLDLEPAFGFWVPAQRMSVPVRKTAANMPGDSSAARLSYTELFVGSPSQVQILLGIYSQMHRTCCAPLDKCQLLRMNCPHGLHLLLFLASAASAVGQA